MSIPEVKEKPPVTVGSPWCFRIATVVGIPVRVHFTFVLALVWLALAGQKAGLTWVILMLAVFVCIILHEFGHALVARKFGIGTRDITLYPIGGVAMLEGRLKPIHELWVALAGPAVNVGIAIIAALGLVTTGHKVEFSTIQHSSMLGWLCFANGALALFNLIPAFPMDGGRVLRAFLALRMPEYRATQIAGHIGQALAILIGLVGFMTSDVVFMFIALFVYIGAGQEIGATVTRSLLEGHRIVDAMQTRYRTIPHGASLEEAAAMLLAGSQHDFPVVSGDETLGILTRNDIARGLATDGPSAYVAAYMNREIVSVEPTTPLEEAVESFAHAGSAPILVMQGEVLVGLLTQENLSEFILLQNALRQNPRLGRTGN